MNTFVYGILLLMILSLTWIVFQIKEATVMDDNGYITEDGKDEEVEERTPLWDDNKQHTENFF